MKPQYKKKSRIILSYPKKCHINVNAATLAITAESLSLRMEILIFSGKLLT